MELKFMGMAFISLLTVMNPLGALPVYLSLSAGQTERQHRLSALKASLSALVTLLVFAFFGHMILFLFSVSLDTLRVVGGALFAVVGFRMLSGKADRDVTSSQSEEDLSITPLGVPLLAGPGSISTVMILMSQADDLSATAALVGVILAVVAVTLAVLLSAKWVLRLIGETGTHVLTRITGLIVMMIAVEFFFQGIKPFIVSLTD